MANYGISLTTTVAKKIMSSATPITFIVQIAAANTVDVMLARGQNSFTSQGDGLPNDVIVCPASLGRIVVFRNFTGELWGQNQASGTSYLSYYIFKGSEEVEIII